jgi:hypothetical protein
MGRSSASRSDCIHLPMTTKQRQIRRGNPLNMIVFVAALWMMPQVSSSATLSVHGIDWRFSVMQESAEPFRMYIQISKNGKTVLRHSNAKREAPYWVPTGAYWKVAVPKVRSPFPVVAISGHSGFGHHEDRLFLGIIAGEIRRLGKPPSGNSGGPLNFRGRADLWLFDDFDYYRNLHEKAPVNLVLFQVDTRGMRAVRKWRSKGNARVKDSTGIRWQLY